MLTAQSPRYKRPNNSQVYFLTFPSSNIEASMMDSITNFTGGVRILQVFVSIVFLVVSGIVTHNQSAISASVNTFGSLWNDSIALANNTDITPDDVSGSTYILPGLANTNLVNSIKPNILSLATSGLTALSLGSHLSVFSFLSGPTPKITIAQSAYHTSLGASELSSAVLWFSSFSYQTSEYGSWGCNSAVTLAQQYNITTDTTGIQLSSILGPNVDFTRNLNDSKTSDGLSGVLDLLYNLTKSEVTFSKWNDTSDIEKQNLYIQLSQDCQMKKASIGISAIGFFLFLLSGGAVSKSYLDYRAHIKGTIDSRDSCDSPDSSVEDNKTDTAHKIDGCNIAAKTPQLILRYSPALIFPDVKRAD